jgi:hypothetical protein
MNHITEEQLVEYCGGETADRGAIEAHLRECAECRAQCESLRQVLTLAAAMPVPEPETAFEARLWRRIRPELAPRKQRIDWREWFTVRRLVPVGALATMILAAFLAGRYTSPTQPGGQPVAQPAAQNTAQVRERILLVAVGDHLDRAQSILLEISNAEPAAGGPTAAVDISREQQRAQELLGANRLYRQTAGQTGNAGVASVLGELEPLLVEIANSPGQVSSSDLDELRRRISARGLLLKVRVLGSTVRERQQPAVTTGPSGQS